MYFKLPNYDDYLQNNRDIYLNGQILCNKCGSTHTKKIYLLSKMSPWFYVKCKICKTNLFKSES